MGNDYPEKTCEIMPRLECPGILRHLASHNRKQEYQIRGWEVNCQNIVVYTLTFIEYCGGNTVVQENIRMAECNLPIDNNIPWNPEI